MTARYVTPLTPGRRNYISGVETIARGLGARQLMPWQREYVGVQTELLDDGAWAYPITLGTVPRQSGKTFTRGPVAIHRGLLIPRARCWLTAQTRQDARDIIVDDFGQLFAASPFGHLGKVRRSAGSEGIMQRNGSFWRAFAPGETALHGKANHLVDVDEPWAFDPTTGRALEQAIFPTFASTGGQFGLLSTAGTADSTWLYSYVESARDAVLAGRNTGIGLVEYGLADDLVDDVRQLLQHERHSPEWTAGVELIIRDHPAYGHTLIPSTVFTAAEHMSPDEFLRGYGNVWTDQLETVIPTTSWRTATTQPCPPPAPGVRTAVGVAAGVGREDLGVVEFWRDHTGRGYARVLHHQEGYGLTTDTLATHTIPGRTATSSTGPGVELVDAAETSQPARVRVARIPDPDYATACAQLLTLIVAGHITIGAHARLDDAAKHCRKKPVGDRWRFDRKTPTVSVALLEALTCAMWQLDHAGAAPEEPAVL